MLKSSNPSITIQVSDVLAILSFKNVIFQQRSSFIRGYLEKKYFYLKSLVLAVRLECKGNV